MKQKLDETKVISSTDFHYSDRADELTEEEAHYIYQALTCYTTIRSYFVDYSEYMCGERILSNILDKLTLY